MSNYYSIISASIRPEIGEKITIGLLILSGKESFLSISKAKISIAKELLDGDLYEGLKNEIKGIQQTYNQFKDKENLLDKSSFSIDKTYINYLSNYKNNVLNFSRLKKIEMTANQDFFHSLYVKFIDSKGIKLKNNNQSYLVENYSPLLKDNNSQLNSVEKFRKNYSSKLKKYYNVNLIVDNKILPDAISPIKFDLVGQNEVKVFAQSIDLERRKYNVEHDVNTFYQIKDLSPNSKKFIISKEPNKRFKLQHQIWGNLKSSEWLEYVDISEVERLKQYAEKHEVEPLLK